MPDTIYIPYTYRVILRETGQFYFGAKYGKKNTNPDTFWVSYTTSSQTISKLIALYGKEAFDVKVLRRFKTAEEAKEHEDMLIIARIHEDLCLNGHCGGTAADTNVGRKIKNADGLSSYDVAKVKIHQTKINTLDVNGLNIYQRSYIKALENNPDLIKIRTEGAKKTMSLVGEDGLNKWQRMGMARKGENNPVHQEGVKEKISIGVKKYVEENAELIKRKNAILNERLDTEIGEDGLTVRQRHSQFMLDNNPTSDTKWYNDGANNYRLMPDTAPEHLTQGRLSFKHKKHKPIVTCPHCGLRTKQSGNMTRYHFDNCKDKHEVKIVDNNNTSDKGIDDEQQ